MTGPFDHCLWGASVDGRNSGDNANYGSTDAATRRATLESLYARPYEVIRVYASGFSVNLNNASNRTIVANGAYLWPSMKSSNDQSTSWVDIANGNYDATIRTHADNMKAIYNDPSVLKNTPDQYLIYTFHHEPQGDNTNNAADFVAAYKQYRSVFLARMASNTGGTAFAGTILFGPIFFGVSYKDDTPSHPSVGDANGNPGPWWPGNAFCDFAGGDPYNWYPAQGGSPSSWDEFSNSGRGGAMVAFCLAQNKAAFIGETGTFEREPASFDSGSPRSATNRWDSTTTSPDSSGGGPPYDRWPADGLVMSGDPTGTLGTKSKAAWIDHLRIFIGNTKFPDDSLVYQVLCWYDQSGTYNRMTNSSSQAIAAMKTAAAAPQFNSGSDTPTSGWGISPWGGDTWGSGLSTDRLVSQAILEVAGDFAPDREISQVILEVAGSTTGVATNTKSASISSVLTKATLVKTAQIKTYTSKTVIPPPPPSDKFPVTQTLLQGMANTDAKMKLDKLETMLRNTRAIPTNSGLLRSRTHPHKIYLQDDLVIWTATEKFSFSGTTTIGGGDTRHSWPKTYNFPTNSNGDFFDSDHLPIVIISLVAEPGLNYPPVILTLDKVRPTFFDLTLHQMDSSTSPPNTEKWWVSIMALGKKGPYHG